MSNVRLSKDADLVICSVYKVFLDRRKSGQNKQDARRFDDDCYLQIDKISNWQDADFNSTLEELKANQFIKRYIVGDFDITDDAIIYMENRFKEGLIEVTDFISKFIP